MIDSVNFVPRYVAERHHFHPHEVVISIGDYNQAEANINGTSHILRLQFLDVEENFEEPKFNEEHLFNKTLAQKIIQFLKEFQSSTEKYKVIIHCEAGISRSAAVALFVHASTQCSFLNYSKADFANKLVVRLLSESSSTSIVIPPHPKRDPNSFSFFLPPEI